MSFDRLAPHYRWMEFLLAGEKLQRCRTAFLDRIGTAGNILIAGEGNGRFLIECRRRFPLAEITVVDASEKMLAAAALRLNREKIVTGQTHFVHSDIFNWSAKEDSFDLVVTHFFLDCFPPDQLEQVIARLSRCAASKSTWLIADFQVPERGWRRHRALVIHALMYLFFRAVTRLPARRLTPPDDFLEAQGFNLRERRTSDWDLLKSDLWQRQDASPRSGR